MLLRGVRMVRSAMLSCCTDDKSPKYVVCGDHGDRIRVGLDVAGELDTMRDARDGVYRDGLAYRCTVAFVMFTCRF